MITKITLSFFTLLLAIPIITRTAQPTSLMRVVAMARLGEINPFTLGPSPLIRKLVANSDINAQDADGRTALMYAVCPILLKRLEACIDVIEAERRTPPTNSLKDRLNIGSITAAHYLLDQKANPDIQDNQKFTALMYAMASGHAYMAEKILEYHPNLELTNAVGKKACELDPPLNIPEARAPRLNPFWRHYYRIKEKITIQIPTAPPTPLLPLIGKNYSKHSLRI